MRPTWLSLCFGLLLAGCASHQEEGLKPVVEVQVARAELADLAITVAGPGYIFGREQANLSARVTAPIVELPVRKGDNVRAGQLLARLDHRDLAAQREEAAAAVADAEANLARVSSATLPTDIERARGQLAAAEAALRQAEKFYERRLQLFEQGAIPRRDLQLSETELAQARAAYEVARRSLELLDSQSRDKEILMAKAKVDQARARLALMEAQLDFTEIRAPFAGTITEQFMFAGDMAKPDAPIFALIDLSTAVARAQVPEAESRALARGQPCSFRPADHPEASFQGRISVVNQAVDPQRRTVECWCEIPNPAGALRAGAFGDVVVVTGSAPRSVVVPVAAVQFEEGTGRGIVMVADPSGMAVRREIQAGQVTAGRVHVESGLAAGESVIVEGGYGLPDGTQIRVRETDKR